jgi:hypothetical protein
MSGDSQNIQDTHNYITKKENDKYRPADSITDPRSKNKHYCDEDDCCTL